jgi:hypothetical protein
MKVGDTRKAAVLGAIALTVVTVAVVRSIPRDELIKTLGSLVGGGERGSSAATELPETVLTNPFYHPKLARAKEAHPGGDERPAAQAGPILPPMQGSLPPVSVEVKSERPAENAGGSQKSDEKPQKRVVAVEAVLKVGTMKVMVSIDGGQAEPREVGDSLFQGVVIAEIQEGAIVLKTPVGRKTILVGHEIEI